MKKAMTMALLTVCMMIGLAGCGHTHEWEPATCETPQTCKTCGETEGSALGHEWVEATCQEAKHCVRCGAVQGEKAEHTWNEATCTEPKICTACGETEGEPLGHSVKEWTIEKEATCSEEGKRVGICERCSKECEEAIEKIPHTPGDWQVVTDYVFKSDGTVQAGKEATVCTVCGEETETREYTVELTLSQKNAVICAYKEIPFWHCGQSFLINRILVDFNDFPCEDAKIAVEHLDIDWDEQAILYAEQNSEGASRAGLTKDMKRYGFSSEQIEKALSEIGY